MTDDGKVSALELVGAEIERLSGLRLTGRDGKMILTGYLVGREWTAIAADIHLGKEPATLLFQVRTLHERPRICGEPLNPGETDFVVCEREPGHVRDWHAHGPVKWNRGLV